MASLLESAFNHVILPPKLPGYRDLTGQPYSLSRAKGLSVDYPVVLYIEEQNYAILIRLLPRSDGGDDDDDNVVFKAFKTSPSSEAVLATEGALYTEALDRFVTRSRKAGASIPEARDSVNPLLTDYAGELAPKITILLRSKLYQRLAKLEIERAEALPEYQAVYRRLFESISTFFRSAI
ncbi:hypothetical protein B0T24DRAFT_596280 [Lasiosphaeria ovina]|uniref:DUF6606 domain-containing protein n=1 Tax=Lasiosphaeria ovina TaxID=92902 RepID=A0AAE0K4L6_9PEZI|nr:hypothetical protein B0T24DRAFT_596280 [Lasiosphaeria ovina]